VDKMVGPYFEQGLAGLKRVSEARAAELAAQPAVPQDSSVFPVDSAKVPKDTLPAISDSLALAKPVAH
jgi:hypothetical protein